MMNTTKLKKFIESENYLQETYNIIYLGQISKRRSIDVGLKGMIYHQHYKNIWIQKGYRVRSDGR